VAETPFPEQAPVVAGPPAEPAPATEAVVAVKHPRRRRTGLIVLTVVNVVLLLAVGGGIGLLVYSQDQWNRDRAGQEQQISEVQQDLADVESDILDRKAEEADLIAKEADWPQHDPADAACLAAVRAVKAKLDAGHQEVPVDYDDPCGVPVSGEWTASSE